MTPVILDAGHSAALRVAGAWTLDADDPRFGGLSALTIDRGEFLALSDSGYVLRFPRPGTAAARVQIGPLPATPEPRRGKIGRDSESLARAPDGGWWVGFEQRHSLFRFDSSLRRLLGRIDLNRPWADNRGAEAIVVRSGAPILAIPESGNEVVEVGEAGMRAHPLRGEHGSVSDAVVLPGDGILLLLRRVTLVGVTNRLALLEREGQGYRVARPVTLALGRFDNGEALAVEPLPSGKTRLWLVTDNDFRPSRRTLLVAIDLPSDAIEPRRQPL